ncbi:MAG: sensor histidine kinase, partial [Candidatus Thorarchaeota archaeon]
DEMEIRLLKDLGDSLDKMERIVSKTKATGQLMASVLEPRDLIKTVRNSVERFLISKGDLEVEMSLDTAEASVLADPLLDSLVTNIIENAYEHNPKDDKRIWIELISVDRGFELRIADNGPGIPHDVRTGLVDPSRRQGGVGLHMSRHIVEKYGGTLTIEDRVAKRPQGGTLVRIWLPVTSPGAPEEAS